MMAMAHRLIVSPVSIVKRNTFNVVSLSDSVGLHFC